jgi:hypothetical protein
MTGSRKFKKCVSCFGALQWYDASSRPNLFDQWVNASAVGIRTHTQTNMVIS